MKTSLKLSTSNMKVSVEIIDQVMTITLIDNSRRKIKSHQITVDIKYNDIIKNLITNAKNAVIQKKKTGISDEYVLIEETKDKLEFLIFDNKTEKDFLCLGISNVETGEIFYINIVVKDVKKFISIISDIVQVESSENL